ncbi:MAG TPA: energy-coupling factor ABC transporter permease [Actinomycetota bacterium]|jgi:cobalt/nickel transport system permease protein
MHIPDGFIDTPVSVAAGVVAVAGVAVAIKKAPTEIDERRAPLAGLVAAFLFAAQMLNFPVAAGTSGHLLGGVLAAVLVGPWTGMLCVSLVLLVQGLVFADGGLSALGLNIVNMGLIGAVGGYGVYRAIRRVTPANKTMVVISAGVAAGVSVVLASIGFWVEYALGGTTDVSLGAVFAAMVGTHALIGIGEGLITALTVGAVLAVRPDLVYGAQDLLPPLTVAPPRVVRTGGG